MNTTRRISATSAKKPARITLYRYHDYRLFLKDMIEYLRQSTYRFSLRKLAIKAGFSTPNIFQLVLNGQRKLSTDGIEKVADLFELSDKERDFFRNLVNMGQADSHEDKDLFYRKLTHSQRYSVLNKDDKYLYKYYSRWYFPVIRELVATSGFNPDPSWIASRIAPSITVAEATRALKTLEQCKQIRKTANGYEQITPVVTTGEAVSSVAVTKFHKTMIKKAVEALEQKNHSQRNISSLTFAASKETYSTIVKEIYSMQQRIIAMLEYERKPEEVFQLNFQFFPCTQQSDKA